MGGIKKLKNTNEIRTVSLKENTEKTYALGKIEQAVNIDLKLPSYFFKSTCHLLAFNGTLFKVFL